MSRTPPPRPTVVIRSLGDVADGTQVVEVDPTSVTLTQAGRGRVVLEAGTTQTRALIGAAPLRTGGSGETIEVVVDGWRFELEVEDARRAALRQRATRRGTAADAGGRSDIRAIIPGRVVAVSVVAGDTVVAGQTLLVIEAMKMQNELRAPRDGRVESVEVGVGETIDLGRRLVVLG